MVLDGQPIPPSSFSPIAGTGFMYAQIALPQGTHNISGAKPFGITIYGMGGVDSYAYTGGTLLNLKFTPAVLAGDAGIERLAQLVRGYFTLDGHHVQFNVVDAATLRAAQASPEEYRGLIVRVAGYSDYFCDLSPALQEEIIARTAHEMA